MLISPNSRSIGHTKIWGFTVLAGPSVHWTVVAVECVFAGVDEALPGNLVDGEVEKKTETAKA